MAGHDPTQPSEKRFLVALSFPGEHRKYVKQVAEELGAVLGQDRVFYDNHYKDELARPNLDLFLQEIYRDQSSLVVPFFCADYQNKKWCNVEWRSIRVAMMSRKNDQSLMPIRFDDTEVDGLLPLDGYISAKDHRPPEIAGFILKRLEKMGMYRATTSGPPHSRVVCLHNLPFQSIGDLFKGREAQLEALKQTRGPAAITQSIQGLGGIGKTRLAVEIGWNAFHDRQHRAVLFVSAESPSSLRSGLAGLTRTLELPEREARDEESQAEAALRWLSANGEWLLILDNADEPEAVKSVRLLMPRLSRGRVLITSRRHGWGSGIQGIDLPKISDPVAVEFLLQRTRGRTKRASDPADALKLVRELGGLPLALELAGAYIDGQGGSFAEYLADWERDRERLLRWIDPADPSILRPVAMTWHRTFGIMSPAARALVRLAAHLAPEPIPNDLFLAHETRFAEAVSLIERDASSSPSEALGELAQYSMAERESGSFLVHRLVQEIVRLGIPEEERAGWLNRALALVNGDCKSDPPPQDVRSWPWWDAMRSHMEAIAARADAVGIAQPTGRLMNELGLHLNARVLHAEAEPLMRRALAIAETSFGPDHSKVAIRLNNLAALLQTTNRLTEAEPLMRRALAIDEKALGPDHPEVATDLNNLATLLQDTNWPKPSRSCAVRWPSTKKLSARTIPKSPFG